MYTYIYEIMNIYFLNDIIAILFTIAVLPNVIILAAACGSSCGIIANASIFTRP